MDLFQPRHPANLLPCDGTVHYHGPIFTLACSIHWFQQLLHHIPWQNDELIMFGKHIVTARKVAWFGDPGMAYSYSGKTKQPIPWTHDLAELKKLTEDLAHTTFNSCLLNLYHHGGEGMGWHSDDEKSLGPHPSIASLSFGAERKFSFKHKTLPHATSLILENGSLLIMKDQTQTHWLHSIPKSIKITTPRINLTFRTIHTPP